MKHNPPRPNFAKRLVATFATVLLSAGGLAVADAAQASPDAGLTGNAERSAQENGPVTDLDSETWDGRTEENGGSPDEVPERSAEQAGQTEQPDQTEQLDQPDQADKTSQGSEANSRREVDLRDRPRPLQTRKRAQAWMRILPRR